MKCVVMIFVRVQRWDTTFVDKHVSATFFLSFPCDSHPILGCLHLSHALSSISLHRPSVLYILPRAPFRHPGNLPSSSISHLSARRMLATTANAQSTRRPAKDKTAFYSLLPPSVEFVEGSSSGALMVGHSKFQPINGAVGTSPRQVCHCATPQPRREQITNAS